MKTKIEKEIFWGIANYELIGDGCLNGIWTNNDAGRGGVIMNEIARKNDKAPDKIIGNYCVSWIDPNQQQPITGTLQIDQSGQELHFDWLVGNSMFKGVGLQVGLKNVIAFYWKTGERVILE